MSDLTTLFRGWEFEHKGKAWLLERPSIDVEIEYTRHLEGQAIAGINRNRAAFGEFDYGLAFQGLTRDFAMNHYGWMSAAWNESLKEFPNTGRLFYIWFKWSAKKQPWFDNNKSVADQTYSVSEAMQVYMERQDDLNKILLELTSDPNRFARQ